MKVRNQPPQVKGKRIILRYPQIGDFGEFAKAAVKSRKFHRSLVNPPTDLESFTEFVERNESETNECFLICKTDGLNICGAINLSQIFRKGFQNAYLGYYLFADFVVEGLMTEAVALILRFAFEDLKLHRIEANVQPENLASIAVLERNNFTKEGFSRKYLKIGGRWRDHERWAIIKDNWRRL